MKNLITKHPGKFARHGGLHYHCSEFLMDAGCGLYVEDYLHEIIHLERKRSDRSKNPFLLLLIDISKIAGERGAAQTIKSISGALAALTRETDIKGWYRCDLVIGAVLTEIKKEETDSIKRKVYAGLSRPGTLAPGVFERLDISFHLYPEDTPPPQADPKLYPDILKKEDTKKKGMVFKRAVDILGALAGIVLFSPFFLLIPALIKLTSKGPVFFRQKRVGAFGKPFTFLKFRSMYVGNNERIHSEYVKKLIRDQKAYDEKGARVYKIKDDPRVTPLGKFLRKTSLDELPQFFNVLKGDMSLVGPRPPIPYEIENYDVWHRRRYMEAKPGITGLWQTEGRSVTTFNEMVRMDLSYIEHWSLGLDFKIMIKTPWSMLTSKGAY